MGLFADSKICQGELVGEYLGEVLTEAMYLERQRQFADEKHKYFMNLGGGEVIDASRKAGKCRFCNHSCEPNAETQKWLVNGERRIGIFALVDIPKGDEITFNYNFQRFDAPIACLCGKGNCRGVFGVNDDDAQDDAQTGACTRSKVAVRRCLDPVLTTSVPSAFSEQAGDLVERALITLRKRNGQLDARSVAASRSSGLLLLRNVRRSLADGCRFESSRIGQRRT